MAKFTLLYLLLHSHKQANEIIAQLNVQDFLALVALYNSIDRCHWHNNSGWLKGPVKNWRCIYPSENGDSVISINLQGNNLNGSTAFFMPDDSIYHHEVSFND